MSIQSLSVVVPNKGCVNDCKFCVSRMRDGDKDIYENMITTRNLYFHRYMADFLERLEFARDNGCNTVILTGDSEPQQNWEFLKLFGIFNQMISNPFKKIELQTAGTSLNDEYLFFLRHHVGVNTIALSLSHIFDDDLNAHINGTPKKLQVDIDHLCSRIKKYRFNLRMCLNMTAFMKGKDKYYSNKTYFCRGADLGANQITFRKLYTSDNKTPQDRWIDNNPFPEEVFDDLIEWIRKEGRFLRILDYGQQCYSVEGISTVVDIDCMSQVPKKDLKYLILRPDCKLYSQWEDPGSLIF